MKHPTLESTVIGGDDRTADIFELFLYLLSVAKWLLGVSAVAAIAVFCWSLTTPSWYSSTATIGTALVLPPELLDPSTEVVRSEFAKKVPKWLQSHESIAAAQQRAKELNSNLKLDELRIRPVRADGTVTVTVKADSPIAAQESLSALINETAKLSRPSGAERTRLSAETERLRRLIHEFEEAERIWQTSTSANNAGRTLDATYKLASISEARSTAFHQLAVADSLMAGLTNEALIQPPSLPLRASSLSPYAKALITFVAVLLIAASLMSIHWGFAGSGPSEDQKARFRGFFGYANYKDPK